MDSKRCSTCGKEFFKRYKASKEQWEKQKVCSLNCRRPKQKPETRIKQKASMAGRHVGKENPAYRGEKANVSAIHTWLRKRYPLSGVCSRCGGEKWTERAFLRWPKPYTRDPDDYEEMCRSCHTKYDLETGERHNPTDAEKMENILMIQEGIFRFLAENYDS